MFSVLYLALFTFPSVWLICHSVVGHNNHANKRMQKENQSACFMPCSQIGYKMQQVFSVQQTWLMTKSPCSITELKQVYLDALVIAVHWADAGCAAQVARSSGTRRLLRRSSRICGGNVVLFSMCGYLTQCGR